MPGKITNNAFQESFPILCLNDIWFVSNFFLKKIFAVSKSVKISLRFFIFIYHFIFNPNVVNSSDELKF